MPIVIRPRLVCCQLLMLVLVLLVSCERDSASEEPNTSYESELLSTTSPGRESPAQRLRNADPRVREQAIAEIVSTGDPINMAVLEQIAQEDPSPELRYSARMAMMFAGSTPSLDSFTVSLSPSPPPYTGTDISITLKPQNDPRAEFAVLAPRLLSLGLPTSDSWLRVELPPDTVSYGWLGSVSSSTSTSAQCTPNEKATPLGLTTLFAAGLEKVQLGITTPEEVLRVTEPDERSC